MEREVLIKGLVLRAFLDKLLKAGTRRLPTKRIWVERKGPGGQIVGFWQTVHYQPVQASQGSLFGDSPKEEAKPSGRGKKAAPVQQGSLFDAPQEPSEANPAQPALFDGDPAESGNVRAKHESILEAVQRRADEAEQKMKEQAASSAVEEAPESADSGGKEAGGQIHAEEGKGPSETPSGPGEGPVAEAPSPSGDSGKEAPEPAGPSKEEADAEEIRQKAYKENRIAGIADLRAGDRVWSDNHKKYGKVLRLGAHTAYLAFPRTPLGRAVPVEMGIRNHGLWWRSPDDAEAAVRMGMSIRPLREKPAGPVQAPPPDKDREAVEQARQVAQAPSKREAVQQYAGAGEKVASGKGITVSHNKALGGVEIRFPGPISPDMSARLKAKGFKYSSRQKLWYARHSDERLRFAQGLAEG